MGDEAREVTGTQHVVRTLSSAQSGWESPAWYRDGWDLTWEFTGSVLLQILARSGQ